MNFPAMGHSGRARIHIPDLSGGVNYRDALSAVGDNQLTDVRNMWYKDGALRTRPALKIPHEDGVGYTTEYEALTSTSWRKCQCPSGYTLIYAPSGLYPSLYKIYAFDVDGYYVGVGTVSGHYALIVPFGHAFGGVTYDAVAYTSWTGGRGVYGIRIGTDAITLTEIDPYAPIVMINGKGRAAVGADAPGGAMLEGYSLLTGKYRAYYNTDAASTKYYLPTPMQPYTAKLEYRHGAETWEWQLNLAASSEKNGKTQIKAKLSLEGYVELSAALPEVTGASNNLCVTGFAVDYAPEYDVAQANAYAWFGGTRSGLNGGTRLFIGGGTLRNRLCWSDAGNPFYISENNYANIGTASGTITGFGKQSDALVIFKEREIYYTTYNDGISYTAEDVVNGAVVDAATLAATFPMAQISGNIGCDLPETIKLMQNRLVWADSDGKIWTLTYTSEYNQRNVRPVGGMVERKFREHNLDRVSAAVYGDYYILLVTDDGDTTGYALDTAEYGYSYYTGYRSEGNAQKKMAWYVWSFPQIDGGSVTVLGSSENSTGSVLFILQNDADASGNRKLAAYAFDDGEDETTDYAGHYTASPISCMFVTKLFDMGRPEREKMFDRLYIGFGQTESLNAGLTYITEKGEFEDSYRVTAESVHTQWTAQFIRTESITPNMRCRRLAVKVENEGALYVEGLALSYRA